MEFTCKQKNGTVYVLIAGNVEQQNEQELMKRMRALLYYNFNEAIFDLTNVPFITRPTIGKFLMFYKNTAALGRRMKIKGINDRIYQHFYNLRLDRLFPVER